MRLKLSQDRQGRPCDDWGSTQLVEMKNKKKQVGQLAVWISQAKSPTPIKRPEPGVQSYSGHLSGVSQSPPPVLFCSRVLQKKVTTRYKARLRREWHQLHPIAFSGTRRTTDDCETAKDAVPP